MTLRTSGLSTDVDERARPKDAELRARARAVIPGGMYGHLNMNALPPEYPQFFASGRGARVVDVDGREFVDLMCSWGPVLLVTNIRRWKRPWRAKPRLVTASMDPQNAWSNSPSDWST